MSRSRTPRPTPYTMPTFIDRAADLVVEREEDTADIHVVRSLPPAFIRSFRLPNQVTIEQLANGQFRVVVVREEGEFEKRFDTEAEVRAALWGIDLRTFPADITYPPGWTP